MPAPVISAGVKCPFTNGYGMIALIDTRLYEAVKGILDVARAKAYAAGNFAMVEAYWHIGKQMEKLSASARNTAKACCSICLNG
jgi:hypothetical protein